LQKRDVLLRRIEEFAERIDSLDDTWRPVHIPNGKFPAMGAEDGSYNAIEYRSALLYGICAEVIVSDEGGLQILRSGDVDILYPYRYVRDRLRIYMSIFELKTTLRALKRLSPSILLIDGSIISAIIRPLPFKENLTPDMRALVEKKYLSRIVRSVKSSEEVNVFSKELLDELREDFGRMRGEIIAYLEFLENLAVLREVLSDKYRDKIVSISKTSRSTEMFNCNIPDIAILEKLTREEGYARIPYIVKITKERKRYFPVFSEFFRSLEFTVFYARLKERGQVLKFEVPRVIDDDEIVELLSYLKTVSVDGYPYLLKRAHRDVIISNEVMEHIAKHIIGIHERKGREIL